jgi:nitroreductase
METNTAIKSRQTIKVRVDESKPLPPEGADLSNTIDELIETAGWAPFHYPCHESHRETLHGIEPWRFYIVDRRGCRTLLERFQNRDPLPAPEGLSQMLAAADAMVIATWLPDPAEEADKQMFKPTARNMEHIAAAAAACQNFLLAATAKGLNNYWSSGGVIRHPRVFDSLGIPTNQILLGTLFLFPDMEGKVGKNRELRSAPSAWSKKLDL